jgi:hypothetical protein
MTPQASLGEWRGREDRVVERPGSGASRARRNAPTYGALRGSGGGAVER